MECLNCGFDLEGWKEITTECKVEITLTAGDNPMAYILLKHKDVTIGSFDGVKFSYHELNKTPDLFNVPKYKVLVNNRPNYHQYFNVFKKSD